MKNIYLLALLPLSLITTGASGSPHTFVGNFKIEAPIGSKLTVDYPTGFGAMGLSSGEMVYANMFVEGKNYYLGNETAPNDATFQTNVLSNDFTFNTAVVNASTFKNPLYVYKGRRKTSRTIDFQAALLKTSFTDDSLSGKTAVLTFGVPSKNRQLGKSLRLAAPDLTANKVNVRLNPTTSSPDPERLALYFQMLCAKHPTESDGSKGISVACTSNEFKHYDSGARFWGTVDKYKMSLLGSSSAGDYYHNTIAFVPYAVRVPSQGSSRISAGTYEGSLTVTFGVE